MSIGNERPGSVPAVTLLLVVLAVTSRAEPAAVLKNAEIRATLDVRPSATQWSLTVDVRVGERWRKAATVGIGGVFEDEALRNAYRQRFKTYYPLQSAMPRNVQRTLVHGREQLAFRLVRDDLWLDVQLSLVEDAPFLLLEAPAASRPELRPETSIRFHIPVRFLVADADKASVRRREWTARDYRERSLHVTWKRYMAPWAGESEFVPLVLCPPDDAPRRAHWGRGGLSAVHLDAPYALAFDTAAYERTAHSVSHRAVGYHSQLKQVCLE